jgi:beta-galactosidase
MITTIQIKIRLVITGLAILMLCSCQKNVKISEINLFNNNWEFFKTDTTMFSVIQVTDMSDSLWEDISLPHTASIEPLVMKDQQWTGICWYKKNFFIDKESKGKHIAIVIEAAMNDATIWLNGNELKRHLGGYLPIFLDISDKTNFGSENTLLVRLDNRNNTQIPPGKHLTELDFNYYSGIYRNAYLFIKDNLHFTHPLEVDSLFGGGLMVNSTNVSANEANVNIDISIINQDERPREYYIEIHLKDSENNLVYSKSSEKFRLPALTSQRIPFKFTVPAPNLWSPDSPYLYKLETILHADNRILETENTRIGIREIKINREGFFINGEKLQIRGTNRHQEYPYVGYALSDNAQYRDAKKIKNAGFNFVRSAHYPQSPAYIDACDELGILVMDAIPGWQFIGDSVFQELSFRNTREMCRRDRNHPSIILWEASLNETAMPVEFMQKSHQIVHTELPYEGIYTCGWMDTIYDVFIPARQHAIPPDYWNKYSKNKAIFIAEYGSWEYYAQNAGFNQTEFKDLLPAERSSRQLRGYGEIHLLQQAYNFQEAFNSNLAGPAIGSSNWGMYDYNRGYADNIETSGIMDIFRLPKFTYWFYKSQSHSEPVCFVASFNTNSSAKYIRIFSNGDSIVLYRNGKFFAAQKPDINPGTANLTYPPFTFIVNSFEPGTIRAESYRAGKKWAEHTISTAGKAAKLKLEADFSGRALKADGGDIIFVYASITDKDGYLLCNSGLPVKFKVDGDATLIGDNPFTVEAGIACILLKAGKREGKIVVKAESQDLISASIEIMAE